MRKSGPPLLFSSLLSLSLSLSHSLTHTQLLHYFLSPSLSTPHDSPNGHDAGPAGSGHRGLENGLSGRVLLLLLQGVALTSHRPRHQQQALKHKECMSKYHECVTNP